MSGRKAKRLELSVEIEKCVIARGGSREDISIVFSKRRDVFDRCAELILAAVREMNDRLEFTFVVRDGETFISLVEAGAYDWKDSWVTAERFLVRPSPVGKRKLVLLYFGRSVSSKQAIEEGKRQGLERPTYEDALRFGAQHREVQRQFPIVFLHEPVRDDGYGDLGVLYLGRDDSGRGLRYDWFFRDWSDGCRFAFVSK
ncbi:MAG: hypothetical protein A3A04_01535 [Candidatus Harrisonbacteria bacterium RIFCSPLOWO2_01_FULL_40_28]|uniref:Uncharacterized protein n=1 Tax=Candidatus Harrisonbacteria bacterium RIFCSPLOWO2_01_FULL_40_28 TaxID=1798406 RepID=A0A1G1ZPR1_9BACT|nr:MAG: hypothetical protein A3A04_01535 [Candidatus Harrisonbacteria bacterium RIFCSPLOWO2_01_FULL_40_28]